MQSFLCPAVLFTLINFLFQLIDTLAIAVAEDDALNQLLPLPSGVKDSEFVCLCCELSESLEPKVVYHAFSFEALNSGLNFIRIIFA